jgi:hypothetical protein
MTVILKSGKRGNRPSKVLSREIDVRLPNLFVLRLSWCPADSFAYFCSICPY